MKGEYHRDNKTPPPQNMFSKFHHQQPSPQHFAITSHPFQLSNTSDEPETKKDASTTANDGASIESVKRPRGRPPGSKNKPKPPVIITREPDPAMAPYVLELPAATDIIDAVNTYCRKRNTGLCILTGSGTVTNVSLRQPTTASSGGTVTFHGRFDILSISATVFPSSSTMAPFANGFTISLAGPQGQIVGGAVAGPLMSAGPVFIIAASFNNPMYHRLPSEEEHSGGASGSVAASEQSPPAAGDHQPAESMSMYSSHLPSDVIWAPTARQAQLHPPPY
ncbi:AT-hook motif nuclear-localized protein 17-like [Bidens hawaiensis]|uniref:AT-hook motif nuclear-localized protein 17-like n=1 Tax=Bidens hawaiensis TaxID=980011 RepID=UPI00404A4C19